MSGKLASSVIGRIRSGIVVSCQAADHSALNRPCVISAMALAAQENGAMGIRVNGSANIRAVGRSVQIPVIGIEKRHITGSSIYITPAKDSVCRVCRAGADIVALDFTSRKRPRGESLLEIVKIAKKRFDAVIMADIASLEEGIMAEDLGADLVATTLHGYTYATRTSQGPAFALVRDLVRRVNLPVVLEGRVQSSDDVRKAFDLGAHSVVVGTAITGIEQLVRRFVEAAPTIRMR